jgi:hypothetical protein
VCHILVAFTKELLARLVLIRVTIHSGITRISIAFDIGHTRIGNPRALGLPFDIVLLVALIMDLATPLGQKSYLYNVRCGILIRGKALKSRT